MSIAQEPKKDAQFFVRPATKEATAESLGDQIADGLIAQVNEHRAKRAFPRSPTSDCGTGMDVAVIARTLTSWSSRRSWPSRAPETGSPPASPCGRVRRGASV